jgi:hypothetical protein
MPRARRYQAQDAYVWARQAQANIPVVTHDDSRWGRCIAWGTPTRYGNMRAQIKQFVTRRALAARSTAASSS